MYVGKTSRSLRIRVTEHKSAIRRRDVTSPVARHFVDNNHDIDQLKCIGIERVEVMSRL